MILYFRMIRLFILSLCGLNVHKIKLHINYMRWILLLIKSHVFEVLNNSSSIVSASSIGKSALDYYSIGKRTDYKYVILLQAYQVYFQYSTQDQLCSQLPKGMKGRLTGIHLIKRHLSSLISNVFGLIFKLAWFCINIFIDLYTMTNY